MTKRVEASEDFIDAICTGGSLVVTCDLCGTTHFGDHGDFDAGELERLEQQAKDEPKKFRQWVGDTIDFGQFEGKTLVPGCSPECDAKIAYYEQWLLSHRYIIARFFNARAKNIVRQAELDAELTVIKDKEP